MGFETYYAGELTIEPPLTVPYQQLLEHCEGIDERAFLGKMLDELTGELRADGWIADPEGIEFGGWNGYYEDAFDPGLVALCRVLKVQGHRVNGTVYGECDQDEHTSWKYEVKDNVVTRVEDTTIPENDPRLHLVAPTQNPDWGRDQWQGPIFDTPRSRLVFAHGGRHYEMTFEALAAVVAREHEAILQGEKNLAFLAGIREETATADA